MTRVLLNVFVNADGAQPLQKTPSPKGAKLFAKVPEESLESMKLSMYT